MSEFQRDPALVQWAGRWHRKDAITGTLKILRSYRAFLSSAEFTYCPNFDRDNIWSGDVMTKDQVRAHLAFLVNVSINRKANIPDVVGRKQESFYQDRLARDCRAVRERINHRVRVYSFDTREIRNRYRHLLSRHDD